MQKNVSLRLIFKGGSKTEVVIKTVYHFVDSNLGNEISSQKNG